MQKNMQNAEKTPKNEEKAVRLVPALTKELLAKNEEHQAQLRKVYGSMPDAQTVALARFRILIEENKTILSALLLQLKNTVSISPRYRAIEEIINLKAEETADAYAEIGEFELAAKFSTNADKKKLFKNCLKALALPDEAHCEHAKYKLVEGTKQQNYFREKDVFSPAHNRFVSVIKCNECDFRNIRPLPEDLAQLSEMRAEYARQNKS